MALFQNATFRQQAAITELETIVQYNPDGLFYFLLGELKAIQITSRQFKESDLSELYPIFRQAVEAPSAFPFHRRQAALWMISCAGPQATPGEACFDPQVRERTIAAISDSLKYEALTPVELGRLALISSRAKLPDSCKLVCDRWMHDHPADMEAVRWAMRLALNEQHYVRVLEIFQGLPADASQPADLQSLADAARTKLREAAAKFPQEPAAKEAKPTARDAPARP